MEMSEILQKFYDEIGEWILSGCPEGREFGNTGLCSNLRTFMYNNRKTHPWERERAVEIELEYQFREAGLNPEYPFDDALGSSYRSAMWDRKLYDNPLRYQWVFDHMSSAARLHLIKGI